MSQSTTPPLDTDTLISAAWARVRAITTIGGRTASLAVAELKLAVSSAALAVAVTALLVLMLFLTWAMLLVGAFFLLRQSGFEALPAMGLLLLLQGMLCAALIASVHYLLKQTRFTNTRNAIQETSAQLSNSKLSNSTSTTEATP